MNIFKMKRWIYVWDSLSSDDATIDGVKIQGDGWELVQAETAKVTDPIYGKKYIYPVYEYKKPDGTILRVATREQTPGVYLAYVDDKNLVNKVHPKPTRKAKFS